MIRETALLTDEPSKRKNNLVVQQSTYEFLRDTANSGNDMMSKGVVVYEVLLLTESEREKIDVVDDLEEEIDRRLSECTSTAFVDSLQKIKFSSDSSSDDMDVFDSYYESLSANDAEISLQIPVKLDESEAVDGWGFNRQLNDVVEEYCELAYRDRKDRIECKRELVEYIQRGSEPDHRIAEDIVDGVNKRFGVLEIHHALQKYIGDWWESNQLTFEDIENRQERDQERLTTHDRDERIEALYNAYENEKPMSEVGMKQTIRDVFDVDSDPTVNSYIADLKVEYGVGFEDDVDDVVLPMDEVKLGDIAKIDSDEFTEKHVAYAVDEALANYEGREDYCPLKNMRNVLSAGGWIDNRNREATELLNKLDRKYNIDSMRKIKKGEIRLN